MPPKPFKPPRPSSTTKKATKSRTTATAPRKSTDKAIHKVAKSKARTSGSTTFSRPSIASSLALEASDDSDDPFASDTETQPRAEIIDVDTTGIADERKEGIPEPLLTRLMHECFNEEGTRISKDASVAIQKYMETFVREALARAVHERANKDDGAGDGFLEVEDLEKLAPQLLLDF